MTTETTTTENEQKKNPPCEPATDEEIEKWQVQVDYGATVATSIARSSLGGILARLKNTEAECAKLRTENLRLKAAVRLGDGDIVP